MVGAGCDDHVHVWDIQSRRKIFEFAGPTDSGGISVAMSPRGDVFFLGTYYAWGVACVSIDAGDEIWRRRDLKRLYGLRTFDQNRLACWFDSRAGLTLDIATGETLTKHNGLERVFVSRFDNFSLKSARGLELWKGSEKLYRWPRASFATLASAFSETICVISEAGESTRAFNLQTGQLVWKYEPIPGTHIVNLDYSQRLTRFVGVEYAYTDGARKTAPIVALLHFDASGQNTFRREIRDWHETVFCCDGDKLLNGVGELFDTESGDLEYVFEFPR